jgi:hypothetical protein
MSKIGQERERERNKRKKEKRRERKRAKLEIRNYEERAFVGSADSVSIEFDRGAETHGGSKIDLRVGKLGTPDNEKIAE